MSEQEQVRIHILTAPWGIGSYRYKDDEGREDMGYGFYRPENPNDFFPDYECCSESEVAAHKAACEDWDKKHLPAERQAKDTENGG